MGALWTHIETTVMSYVTVKSAVCLGGVPVGIGIFWCIEKLIGKKEH
jgi:hypothetical protein